MQTILQYVPIGLLTTVAVIVFFNVIKALIRGFKKTIGTLIAIVISAVVAAIITFVICKPDSSVVIMLMDLLKDILPEGEIASLFEVDGISGAATYYAVMLIAPIFFTVVYSVLSIIFAIIVAIIVSFIPPHEKPGAVLHRLGGMGVGLVCGLLVVVILMMPAVGMLKAVSTLDAEQLKTESGDTDDLVILVQGIHDITADPIFVALDKAGCGPLYDLFASAEFEGEKVYLSKDLGVILGMLDDVKTLEGDIADYDDTQINALRSIVSEMEASPLLKDTVASLFATAAQKWVNGEAFIGIEKFSAGELFDPVIDGLLAILATSEKETISDDLNTMIDIFAIVIDSGILKEDGDYQAMLKKLGDGVISDLLVAINKNSHMSPLSDEITTLSIRALATTLGLPENADEQYNKLMTDIADILQTTSVMSKEERVDAVHSELCDVLDEYGVEISGEAARNVTESVLADLGDATEITSADIEEFFIVYGIAMVDGETRTNGKGHSFDLLSAESGDEVTITDDGKLIVNGRELTNYTGDSYMNSAAYTSGADGKDFGGAATLSSAEKMESVLITMDDLLNTLGSFSDIENVEAEAAKIADVIAEAAVVLTEVDFDNAKPEELLDKVGGLLDKMKQSEIFGENSTSGVLTAVLQNDAVTSSLGISGGEATAIANKMSEIANKSETGYTDTTAAMSATINAINTSKDPNKSAEEKRQASETLINLMTADNADLLTTVMNTGAVTGQGGSTEKADNVSLAMELLLGNLAEYKAGNPDEEDVAREADAVNYVLNLAMSAQSNNGKLFDTAEEKGSLGATSEEFIHTVVSSTSIMKTVDELVYEKELGDNPLGISELDADEKENVENTLQNYYDENGGGAELERKLEAIAKVINLNIDIQ